VGDQGVVLRSVNKGHNWQIIHGPNQNFPDFNGLDIISGTLGMTHIMIAGDNGKVYQTTSGGGNWSLIARPVNTTKKLNSIAVAYDQVYCVVGDSGAVYRTIDGGQTWENRSIAVNITLKKIVSMQYDRYCAVGSNGTIITSTDYGFSWSFRTSGTASTFNDVIFSGLDSGTVVGDNKVVRVTTNGGITWQADPSLDSLLNTFPQRNIISITQVDENTVNTISRRTSSDKNAADSTFIVAVSSEPFLGIEPISNFIAKVFSLKQNFPNPFNPVTNIRFDIPANVKGQRSNVKIIIYDITGKEIEVLVDEAVRAGQYEIKWDGANYPSGVYFYTIIANDYSQTRKMVLVK
jgi:hypothetical protein